MERRRKVAGVGRVLALASAVFLAGCLDALPEEVGGMEGVEVAQSALTNADVFGFETPSAWSTTTPGVVLSSSTTRSQGSFSLTVKPSSSNGFTPIASIPLPTLAAVGSTLSWDVMLPTQQANPNWLGTAQVYLNCPTRNILSAFLGQVELTGKPLNVWNTVSFPLTNTQVSSLLQAGYSDLTVTVVINVAVPTTGIYKIDNLRFQAVATCAGKPNGTMCNDGNACTQSDTCQAGTCTGANPKLCAPTDECHTSGTCNPGTGACTYPTKPNGSACNDGNKCTQTDTCQSGACVGTNPRTCPASDQCHTAGTCSPSTGRCSNPAKANGTTCNDGNACTQTDKCQAGTCTGTPKANGTTCDDGKSCTQTDKCQAGVCAGTPKANGSACSDGNACTQSDSCQAGTCTGANPKVCTASDQNHTAGTCAPSTGICSNPAKTTITWADAPIVLTATKNHETGQNPPAEKTPSQPVTFTIPEFLYVNTGNAGMGQAELKFRVVPSGTIGTCLYAGGARQAHPTSDLERMRGRRYHLTGCDNGFQLKQTLVVDWMSLRILSGDAQDFTGVTSVTINAGGGCSDQLPNPIAAEEVVAMRDAFSWRTIPKLPETDVEGHPAMFHGLIYIDRKDQLPALDRLRVFWSAMPLSERYMSDLKGKCGRVEHASDGRGAVAYAVFPARVFNVLRDFAIQALNANIEPPFKFIVPTPPDQPQFVNTDGSLKYSALGSSGFGQWLAAHPGGQPGWFSDSVDWVSDTAEDVGDWIDDNILGGPVTDALEYGYNYTAASFDFAIDWTANFVDNVWEETQLALGAIVGAWSGTVDVRLNITMLNRDGQFVTNSPLTRAWGPPNAAGNRPSLVPAGARVRIRQWGFGFLPVMNEAEMPPDGVTSLQAVKGALGQAGDNLCIEMDTDYAMITTDFFPNEVCDLKPGRYSLLQDNVEDTLLISQPDLLGLTQIKDSYDYMGAVFGSVVGQQPQPYRFEVLTGWVANQMTNIFSDGRAMCLCLDFPGSGMSLVTTVVGDLAELGLISGPQLFAITEGIALVATSLIAKDMWWPDTGSFGEFRDSRGMMTHEYGHFAMCSMLYDEGGPSGLTGLISRVFEGADNERSDEGAQMTEALADNFALQVVGGAAYIQSVDATAGKVHFCTTSPCMDQNYIGDSDFNSGLPFYDELARHESLIFDAFDRADSSQRFTNAPANGDVWFSAPSGSLEMSPSPYIANSDENVSLPGVAWRTWITRWTERGLTPTRAHVIGGLVQTMADYGSSWCEICDLLALHDKSTPLAAFGGNRNPTGLPAATYLERFLRWEKCTTSGEIQTWLGSPPGSYQKLSASCAVCPLHNIVDASGTCQPCPSGNIAATTDSSHPFDHCVSCGGLSPSPVNETCINQVP